MNNPSETSVKTIAGQPVRHIETKAIQPFSSEVIFFLSSLSSQLLKKDVVREYPDLAGFGYWCRKSNILKLATKFQNNLKYVGRGLAFHISPSNIPLNCAFSWAFGLLAGCPNIVRLPTKNFKQIEHLCFEIKKLIATANIAGLLVLIL